MYIEPKVKRDGWTNLWGGVDSGRASNLLDKNQCAFAVNVTLRTGFPETRPPFVTPKLAFENIEYQSFWSTQECQGAKYFAPTQGDPLIVGAIGGRFFTIDVLAGFIVRDVTPSKSTPTTGSFISPPKGSSTTITVVDSATIQVGDEITIGDGNYTVMTNMGNTMSVKNETATAGLSIASGIPVIYRDVSPRSIPQVWLEQADEWLIGQDGKSSPWLFNGTISRRTKPTDEVPTGTAMVFNEEIGRLAVGTVDNKVIIGDIEAAGQSEITFTENTYLNEGFPFKIPQRYGPITGACMLANQDRSNGQGAMLFFTESNITAFNLPPNRDQWKNVQYPLQIAMPIHGATGHNSIVNVNGDVFYRGKDGLRSFALTRQEFNEWGNTPMSRELGRVLDVDDRKLLRFATSCLFDNRLLFTAAPRKGRYGAYHEMLCVLDFEGVSRIRRVPPRFDGVWTGIKPQHFVTGNFGGEERCFAFCRDAVTGGVQLWEILREGTFDGDEGRIKWWIESRALDFGNPFELTRLEGFEMWVDKVVGTVDFDLKHKADLGPCWADWATKKICQKHKTCADDSGECITLKTYRPGHRSRLVFGQPPDENENAVDNRPMRVGYQHELRLEGTGRARVKWCLAKSVVIPEDANPPIETEES